MRRYTIEGSVEIMVPDELADEVTADLRKRLTEFALHWNSERGADISVQARKYNI